MEEAVGKIIVYDSYDTVVQANLVKTKLDAYGIPCFLSEENFTSWYPFRNQLFPGVRLHIFEKDYSQVSEILEENHLSIDETRCPQCSSKQVTIEESTTTRDWHEQLAHFLMITPARKVYRCHDCQHEWD